MPFRIQRSPRVLNNLLSIFGGETPIELEDRVRGTIDLLQAYGAPQRQLIQINNPALTEGVALPAGSSFTPTVPFILYGASLSITQTATLTALHASIWLGISPTGYKVASQEFTTFGATVTGVKAISWYAPYPILLGAGTGVFGTCDIIGTDANVSAGFSFDVALLA